MLVTVNADASFCPDTKAGGYGLYVASSRSKRSFDGRFKDLTANSTSAELKALVLGLYFGIKFGIIKANDVVLLQSDCIPALDKIEAGKSKKVNEYIERFNLTLKFKHVKGHAGIYEGRFLSNHINDRKAYLNMVKMRKTIKLKEAVKNAGVQKTNISG